MGLEFSRPIIPLIYRALFSLVVSFFVCWKQCYVCFSYRIASSLDLIPH